MTGQKLIDYIQKNNLQEAAVEVHATIYYRGDHECMSTDDISLSDEEHQEGRTRRKVLVIYADDNLY